MAPVDRVLLGDSSHGRDIMIRLIGLVAVLRGVAGCVAVPANDYGYAPYGPGYYAPGPVIGLGVGGGSFGGGVGVGMGVGF